MKVKKAISLLAEVGSGTARVSTVLAGSSASEFLTDVCDDVTFDHAATYLSWWRPDMMFKEFRRVVESITGTPYADFEIPTSDGSYFLFELEDYAE